MCAERGVSVVIGAPYASGILARGPEPGALYNYRPAKPEIIAKAERIAAVCQRHGVPLAAAALQFPFGHRSVVSVIPGPVAAEEVRHNLAWMRTRHPRCALGRARGRGPHPRGRADAASLNRVRRAAARRVPHTIGARRPQCGARVDFFPPLLLEQAAMARAACDIDEIVEVFEYGGLVLEHAWLPDVTKYCLSALAESQLFHVSVPKYRHSKPQHSAMLSLQRIGRPQDLHHHHATRRMGAQDDLAGPGSRRKRFAFLQPGERLVDQQIELVGLIEIAVFRREARCGAAEFDAEGWSNKDRVGLAGVQLLAQAAKQRRIEIVFNSLDLERLRLGLAEGLYVAVEVDNHIDGGPWAESDPGRRHRPSAGQSCSA